MRLQVYKPNPKSTGGALEFNIGFRKDKWDNYMPEFYVNLTNQVSWNSVTKNGSFKENVKNPKKSISTKLGMFELGEIKNCFERRLPWTGFHSFGDNNTSFTLTPWDKNRKVKQKVWNADQGKYVFGDVEVPVHAYGFTVRRGEVNVSVALEPGEIEAFKQLINYYFKIVFDKEASNQQKFLKNKQEEVEPTKSSVTPGNPKAVSSPAVPDEDEPPF